MGRCLANGQPAPQPVEVGVATFGFSFGRRSRKASLRCCRDVQGRGLDRIWAVGSPPPVEMERKYASRHRTGAH